MNYSVSNKKKRKTLLKIFGENDYLNFSIRYFWICTYSIIVALTFICYCFNKEKIAEETKYWHTEVNTKFTILDKVYDKHIDYSPKFILKRIKDGKRLVLNVTDNTYLKYKPGENVWFNVSRADFSENHKCSSGSGWYAFIIISTLVILFLTLIGNEFSVLDEARDKRKDLGEKRFWLIIISYLSLILVPIILTIVYIII